MLFLTQSSNAHTNASVYANNNFSFKEMQTEKRQKTRNMVESSSFGSNERQVCAFLGWLFSRREKGLIT